LPTLYPLILTGFLKPGPYTAFKIVTDQPSAHMFATRAGIMFISHHGFTPTFYCVKFEFYQHHTHQPKSDNFCLFFIIRNKFGKKCKRSLRVNLDIIVHSVRHIEMTCIHQISVDLCNEIIHMDCQNF